MKEGRDLFARVISAQGGMVKAIGGFKGRELGELIRYAEGLERSDGRDEVIGTALIVAAERYLTKARAKAAKKARRARRIL